MNAKSKSQTYSALSTYLVGLSIIILFILSVLIFALVFVLHLSYYLQYLLVLGIPAIYITLLSLAGYGAFTRRKWGLTFNLIFLIVFVPFFVVFPMVMLWIVPHSGVVFPIITLVLGLLIAGFDIYFLYWFIKNRNLFT